MAKRKAKSPLDESYFKALAKQRAALKRQQGRTPGSRWRVQDCGEYRYKSTDKRYPLRFDELAVDSWLHVERCDNRSFYATFAGIQFWFYVEPDGSVVITNTEVYDDLQFSSGVKAMFLRQLNDHQRPSVSEKAMRSRAGKGDDT